MRGRALAAGRGVGRHDLAQLVAVGRGVVRGRVHPGDLPARLDRGLDRLGELLHVGEVRGQRAIVRLRLLVQVAGLEQRLAAQLRRRRTPPRRARTPRPRRRGCPPRASRTRSAWWPRGSARARDRPCGTRRAPRPAAAQSLSCISAAPASYSAAGRIFEVGRGLRDAQEVIGRRAVVLRRVRLLALLVDRGGEVVDHALARRVAPRRSSRARACRPARTAGRRRSRTTRARPPSTPSAGSPDRPADSRRSAGWPVAIARVELLHLVQVVDRRAEHRRGVLVLRELLDEAQRARDRVALDRLLLLARARPSRARGGRRSPRSRPRPPSRGRDSRTPCARTRARRGRSSCSRAAGRRAGSRCRATRPRSGTRRGRRGTSAPPPRSSRASPPRDRPSWNCA